MIKDLLIAWVATVGFAIVFNIPRKDLVFAGICGSMGWAAYSAVKEGTHFLTAAAFVGALTVGVCGEVLARMRRQPVTVYVIPGILPLVPGYGLYRAMEQIIIKDYSVAADTGFRALLVALAISSGVTITSSAGKYYNEWLIKRHNDRKLKVHKQ